MSNNQPVNCGLYTVIKQTSKAILVRDVVGDTHWVPNSVVHDDSEVWQQGDRGDLIVESWFAEKEEWI